MTIGIFPFLALLVPTNVYLENYKNIAGQEKTLL